jgi:hypothetical protein
MFEGLEGIWVGVRNTSVMFLRGWRGYGSVLETHISDV